MAEITRIVITSADNKATATAIDYIAEQLSQEDTAVIVVKAEADTLASQYENEVNALANQKTDGKVIFLIEDALLKFRLTTTEAEFNNIAQAYHLSEDLVRSSYEAVLFLSTNETDKKETEILALWTGAPHLRIIKVTDNNTDWLDSLNQEVFACVGIPEPLEIERKFLIEYPDLSFLNRLKTCRREPITQAYLTTHEEGNFRVRKRGREGNEVYIKTKKIKISDIRRIEIESYITENEYNTYLSQKDCITGIISKDRYCIAYEGSYFELDIYPFWSDRATLEIELLSEEQSYTLPDFIKVIREVTFEPDYRNLALAQKYYSYFKKS